MKLTRMCCAECGAEIIMTYERPNTTFCINNNGRIERHDNNIEGCHLLFHCSEDMEHDITPIYNTKLYKLFMRWNREVEGDFYDREMEDIY